MRQSPQNWRCTPTFQTSLYSGSLARTARSVASKTDTWHREELGLTQKGSGFSCDTYVWCCASSCQFSTQMPQKTDLSRWSTVNCPHVLNLRWWSCRSIDGSKSSNQTELSQHRWITHGCYGDCDPDWSSAGFNIFFHSFLTDCRLPLAAMDRPLDREDTVKHLENQAWIDCEKKPSSITIGVFSTDWVGDTESI